jgi:hypothetical protein
MVAGAGIVALLFTAVHGRPAATLLAGVVGFSAGAAKLSFDALVQRHVPAASQGRAFGRFEAGFQLAWVVGGLVPVVFPLDLAQGFLIVTLAAAVAAAVYVLGTRMARLGQLPDWWPGVHPSARRAIWARHRTAAPSRGPAAPAGGPATAPTIAFGGPDAVTTSLGVTPWVPPAPTSAGPYDDDQRPWLDPEPAPPAPDLGIYPPAIPGPPPLGHPPRPIPPPLAGPPPLAAPLAPRPPRRPPGDSSIE